MRELCDREFDILCLAADALDRPEHDPDKGYLSVEQFAEAILGSCPGPRTALTYAREYVFRLCSEGLLEMHQRRGTLYRATGLAQRYLASTAR